MHYSRARSLKRDGRNHSPSKQPAHSRLSHLTDCDTVCWATVISLCYSALHVSHCFERINLQHSATSPRAWIFTLTKHGVCCIFGTIGISLTPTPQQVYTTVWSLQSFSERTRCLSQTDRAECSDVCSRHYYWDCLYSVVLMAEFDSQATVAYSYSTASGRRVSDETYSATVTIQARYSDHRMYGITELSQAAQVCEWCASRAEMAWRINMFRHPLSLGAFSGGSIGLYIRQCMGAFSLTPTRCHSHYTQVL